MSEPAPILPYANPRADAPPGSRLLIEWHEDGLTITAPPPGLLQYGGDLLGFVLVAVLLGAWLVAAVSGLVNSSERDRPAAWGLIGFLLACLLLIALSFRTLWLRCTRPTIISARGGRLSIQGPGIRYDRPFEQVRHVRAAIRNVSLSMKLVGHLQIGRSLRILNRYSQQELEWVARNLRSAMAGELRHE